MKRKYLYAGLILLITGSSLYFYTSRIKEKIVTKNENIYSELLPRKISLSYTAEWAVAKNNAEVLISKINKGNTDAKSLMTLTALYIQEARITGNFEYYNNAALKCIEKMLEKDPANFEALSFKTTILLSQHRFEDAYVVATQIQKLYPYNAYVYGLLVDANIELGHYKEAIEAADKMVGIRPDIRSYSRIAYLREIHGDLPGAIEAMQLAVDAGAPGDENTEWCRIQTGKLNEKMGNIKAAKMFYTIAGDNRPNYPYAIAGLARIAIAEKDYPQALALYEKADSLISDHTFKEGLAEVYYLTGENEKAKLYAGKNLEYMKQFSSEGKKEKTAGQNEDHEMAHAYMGVENYDKALEYAMQEYKRRSANIEVNETVAIVYYRKSEYQKALPFIETALKTNCRNPELLCHAGLIYAKTGKLKEAKLFLQNGLKARAAIPAELEKESKAVLMNL